MCFVPPVWAWPVEFRELQETSCICWAWAQYPPFCYHFLASTFSASPTPIFSVSLSFFFWLNHYINTCWQQFVPPIPLSLPQALQSVQLLCKVQSLGSVMELYRQHMGQLLDWMSASVNTWSSYSPQRLQLHIIVTQSGEKWSLNVHKTLPNYTAGAEVCTYGDTIPVNEIQQVF